jgi:hypothetical protein
MIKMIVGNPRETYYFYNHSIKLEYDDKAHVYLKDGIPQDNVSSIVHILDKSEALINWACKQMYMSAMDGLKFYINEATGELNVTVAEIETILLDAKNAHRRRLDEAADIGKVAHAWIEQFIKATIRKDRQARRDLLDHLPVDPRARQCCKAALKWMVSHNVRWLQTEKKIYSRKWSYAGTADGLCVCDSCGDRLCCPRRFTSRLSLADWKSSNALYIEYLFQTAAYEQAIEEEWKVDIRDRWVIRLGKEDGKFDPWHLTAETFDRDFDGFITCLEAYRTVKDVKARMKEVSDAVKARDKVAKKAAKEAQLLIKCAYADRYKGTRRPNCKGKPCQTCITKYKEKHEK